MQTDLKNSSVSTLVSVLMINAQGIMISSGPEAIEWPDLDVDLEIDSLRHPERYPLLIKRNELDFVKA